MYRLATKRIAKNEVGNVVNVFMDSGWHAYRKGTARLSTMTQCRERDCTARTTEGCGLRIADADPQ